MYKIFYKDGKVSGFFSTIQHAIDYANANDEYLSYSTTEHIDSESNAIISFAKFVIINWNYRDTLHKVLSLGTHYLDKHIVSHIERYNNIKGILNV